MSGRARSKLGAKAKPSSTSRSLRKRKVAGAALAPPKKRSRQFHPTSSGGSAALAVDEERDAPEVKATPRRRRLRSQGGTKGIKKAGRKTPSLPSKISYESEEGQVDEGGAQDGQFQKISTDDLMEALERVHVETGQEYHDDCCYVCRDGGILICCVRCVHAYHKDCVPIYSADNFHCAMAGQRCTERHERCDADDFQEWEFPSYPDEERAPRHFEPESSKVRSGSGKKAKMKDPCFQMRNVLKMRKPTPGRTFFKRAVARDGSFDLEIGACVRIRRAEVTRALTGFSTVGDESGDEDAQIEFARLNPPIGKIARLFQDSRDGIAMASVDLFAYPQQTMRGNMIVSTRTMPLEVLETNVSIELALGDIVERVHVSTSAGGDANEDCSTGANMSPDFSFVCRLRYDLAFGRIRPIVHRPETAWDDDFGMEDLRSHQEKADAEARSIDKMSCKERRKANDLDTRQKLALAVSQLQLNAAPEHLPCREAEREVITNFISEALEYENSGNGLYICGVPGTGKTATVRRVVYSLMQQRKQADLPEFQYLEINAMKLPTPSHAYAAIWAKIKGQKVSPTTALTRLQEYFHRRDRKRPLLVLLLDEFDYMVGTERGKQQVIYNLFDFQSWTNSRLAVIGIANTLDLPERLMPRVHSRLGLTRLPFKPYDFKQIEKIITARLEKVRDVFVPDALQLCGRKVAGVSGDIRRALQICAMAVELCLDRHEPKVTMVHVSDAVNSLADSPAMKIIAQGALDQQLYLCALIQQLNLNGVYEASYDEVERRYRSICRSRGRLHATRSELREVVDVLFECRVIGLSARRAEPRPLVSLNVMPMDVKHALRDNVDTAELLPTNV